MTDATLWGWVVANADPIGAVASVAAALIAILALSSAASDSRARSQPMVAAEFRIPQDSDSSVDFVITNLGPTPARDLRVTFDPTLDVPEDGRRLLTPFLVKRYQNTIPVLNPGQVLSNIWWSGENRGGTELTNREPTPDEVVVYVSYRGRGVRRIRDSFRLSVEVVTLTTYSVSSTSLRGRLETIDKSLVSVKRSLERVANELERQA